MGVHSINEAKFKRTQSELSMNQEADLLKNYWKLLWSRRGQLPFLLSFYSPKLD